MISPAHPLAPLSNNSTAKLTSIYEETLDYLYGLQHIGIKLGLNNITSLLELLGRPQERFRAVHIAGTNGKGSTAAFIASILQAAGYRVGLYTSPHLIDFSERIKVNDKPITRQEIIGLTSLIRELIDGNTCFSPPGGAHPTFFEFATAMAFGYFADAGVDIVVVETGMGGRLDATNVLNPLVSVITNISLEHQQYLGHTLEKIAREKAGIIKTNATVLSGVKQDEAQGVIAQECQAKAADLYCLNTHFAWRLKSSDLQGQSFDLHTHAAEYIDLRIGLLGDFQLSNAALAVGAVELLDKQGIAVTKPAIRQGLLTANWRGRLQIISRQPYLVLDGAHNPQANRALAANLPRLFDYSSLVLILGVLQDKDANKILAEWINIADVIILTKPDSDRAAAPRDLAQLIPPNNHKQVIIRETIGQALAYAQDTAKATDLICVTGSLYTVGETLAILQGGEGRRKSNQ
jgi:dihydrofolate synthase/folylpolyglutamate synthase